MKGSSVRTNVRILKRTWFGSQVVATVSEDSLNNTEAGVTISYSQKTGSLTIVYVGTETLTVKGRVRGDLTLEGNINATRGLRVEGNLNQSI